MLDQLGSLFATVSEFTSPLGWVAIVLFLVAAVVEWADVEGSDYARPIAAIGWVVFSLFWISRVHYFVLEQRSVVEGLGSVVAIPLSLYVALLLVRGRDSLFTLTRAVAAMGLIYAPVAAIPIVRQTFIEIVAGQTAWVMGLLGFDPVLADGLTVTAPDGTEYAVADKTYPYRSTFVFDTTAIPWVEQPIATYTIVTACTGIGSMAILGGLILGVRGSAERKARALAVSLPVIYVLNIARNVFIGITFGHQMTHFFPETIMTLFALEAPWQVSFIVSDRIIAQGLAVVALIGITLLVVRELPEVLSVVEEVLYLLTGREYDLQAAVGVEPPGSETDRQPA